MSKKVLVTGGGGFIGSNFVSLVRQMRPDWDIRVLDDFSSGLTANLNSVDVEIQHASILDVEAVDRTVRGVDSIVHLAAIGSVPRSVMAPGPTHEANATGTLNILEAAVRHNVSHVLVASSSSVYGSNPRLPRAELDWTRPLSPYAVSKLATEAYANAFASSYGLKTMAFRFFNVYGPRQRPDHPYAAVIPRFISAALAGKPLEVFGDGQQTRDFTYVDSVCEALYLSCDTERWSEHPVNLAFGSRTSVNTLIGALEKILGRQLEVRYRDRRPGEVLESQANPESLTSLLGLEQTVDIFAGLERTVQWFSESK